MTEQDLKSLLAAEIAQALGHTTGDLASQRAEAMDYYLNDLSEHLPAPEGRSQVVASDVADTIESIMPSMMEIFCGGDEVARFNPVSQEDEAGAEQETDYINHLFYQQCNGFLVIHDMIKDTLLQKNGVVKRWWEEVEEEKRESYKGQDDLQLGLLAADPDLKQIERTDYADEAGIPRHDVVFLRKCKYGKLHCESVPPEEFLISKEAKSIASARYVGHKPRKTESDLISEGYPKSKVKKLPSWSPTETQEQRSRSTNLDEQEREDGTQNPAMRQVEIVESYIRVDWDGDGIAELRKVTSSADGSTILDNEEADEAPFSGAVGIRLPHRFIGISLADLTIEIQKINTALTRQLLDNTYLVTNTRTEVPQTALTEDTFDDLLTVRPGGIVRTKVGGQMREIVTPPIAHHLLPVIEFFDTKKETRTGVTRYNQGLDANSLNKTASGITQIMSQAQMRMRLLARMIAETGVKDLMLGIHQLVQKHDRQQHVTKLRNKWVTVDPGQWKTRTDMTISVALGSGSKQEMLLFLQNVLAIQEKAIQYQGGANGPLVTLTNVFNTTKEITKAGGLRSVEPYFTDPAGQPMPQPKPDPKIAVDQFNAETQRIKVQGDHQLKMGDQELEKLRIGVDAAKGQDDAQISREQMQREDVNRSEDRAFKAASDASNAERKNGSAVKVNLPDSMGGPIAEAVSSVIAPLGAAIEQLIAQIQEITKPRRMKRTPVRDPKTREILYAMDEPLPDEPSGPVQ